MTLVERLQRGCLDFRTLGIEDVGVLRTELQASPNLSQALTTYERLCIPRFGRVRECSADVGHAAGAAEFAERYVAFSHWRLTTAPQA